MGWARGLGGHRLPDFDYLGAFDWLYLRSGMHGRFIGYSSGDLGFSLSWLDLL